MKLVIEIEDISYAEIQYGKPISAKVMDALIHGKVLPEGHGRLKDEDEIFDAFEVAIHHANKDGHEYANAFESNGRWCAEYDSIKSMIESAKTIVEADKENE